jgi:hypothetical protein
VLETVKEKIKSSHDVLQDPRLLKSDSDAAEMVAFQHLLDFYIVAIIFGD